MRIIPVLISLTLISIVQAALYTRISRPRIRYVNSQKPKSSEVKLKPKLPEERRMLPLFPKSNKKFVVPVPSEPHFKYVTQKPMGFGTKKPVMRKLVLEESRVNIKTIPVENETARPADVIEKTKSDISDEKLSIEIIEEAVINEITIDSIEENDDDSKESKISTNNDTIGLKDVISPSTAKPIDIIQEKKSEERFSDTLDTRKDSEENELPDLKEFIFIDPTKNTKAPDASSEELDDYITTEIPEVPKWIRKRRGSNVIEEENLASTVAGYKYTWKDTRLNNDLAFKNINS